MEFEDMINGVHCLDYIEGLKMIPPQSIKAIITDPPYKINYQSSHRKQKSKIKFDKIKGDNESFVLDIDEMWKKLKFDGSMFIFFSYKNRLNDKRIKNEIIWQKNDSTMGALDRDFANIYESIAFLPRNNFRLNGFRFSNLWYFSRVPGSQLIHPMQKPLPLMLRLVEVSTKPGDLVFDPFCGSGTTLLAAKALGRNFIGFDIEQWCIDVSNEKLDILNVRKFW